jgi:hypothetical protein
LAHRAGRSPSSSNTFRFDPSPLVPSIRGDLRLTSVHQRWLPPVILKPFLNVHSLYRQIFKIWRRRRFELFVHRIKPKRSDVLLDVGGAPEFWTLKDQVVSRIDCLNPQVWTWDAGSAPHHNIQLLVGDGCALAMPDLSYDIGFSNSVIEHVGSWERQVQFAAEIRRVAHSLWVQTPAYECVIEPHYLAPFIHYLSRPLQKVVIRWCTVRGWIDRPNRAEVDAMVDNTRLLRKAEMRFLFPDCEILTERLLGVFPKSYIAVRHNGG